MAKKKKEEPKVDNEIGSLKVKDKVEKQPDGKETKGNITKVKAKMKLKPEVMDETITKVDLGKPPKQEDAKEEITVDGGEEEVTVEASEIPVIEEVVEEEVNTYKR